MPEMNYKELPVDETSIVPTESEKGQESGHDVEDFRKAFSGLFFKKTGKRKCSKNKKSGTGSAEHRSGRK